jgi:molybdopterin-containing oxidoreductase family iron-sulfur binding subunit
MHPSSLGKSNIFMQASTLELYDPDRSDAVSQNGAEKTYNQFVTYWRNLYTKYLQNDGQGLAVVSRAISSPTIANLRETFLGEFPEAIWVAYEPVSDENFYTGIQQATGQRLHPVYRFESAQVILSIDHDFVMQENENVINAKRFADGRRVTSEQDSMNRLYAVEAAYTLTGGMADHRMRVKRGEMPAFVAQLVTALRGEGVDISGIPSINTGGAQFDEKWVRELAIDLMTNTGQSLVVAGRSMPAVVHAMVYAINAGLESNGNTVEYYPLSDAITPDFAGFADLVGQMQNGEVETLFMLDANPVYNAPADLNFSDALSQVAGSVHLGLYYDETAEQAEWHVPMAHFLEAWGDTRAADTTPGISQPLIAPLFGGHSLAEFVNLMANGEDISGYDILRRNWQAVLGSANFQSGWNRIVHDGVYPNGSLGTESPVVDEASLSAAVNDFEFAASGNQGDLEIIFEPSSALFDGRYANNGWLQELPHPVTKISWDNAAVMSPATAESLNLQNEEVIRISANGQSAEVPVWIVPGFADNTITLELGYGRESAGQVGNQVGFNVYGLRTAESLTFATGASVEKTGVKYSFSSTQDHWSLQERPIFREGTIEEYREHPDFVAEMFEYPEARSLWEEHSYEEGYQWGMAIDLNVCTGCNACTIACQSENNIPIVGKEQVAEGREMHWIRMDRYFSGDVNDPDMVVQPVTCMHCENAPCETVCPVNATVHDDEGLNVQVYNRCIGTRYCSNNCPYKVRRFNFFNYTKDIPEVQQIGQNPDVTIRTRGVMEKCTYCTQRIQRNKIQAQVEDRKLETDEVVSACQQTCPTDAIVFGDINDPESRVSQVKQQNRDYVMLGHLNTQPRTSYQAKIRNPNPALEGHEFSNS